MISEKFALSQIARLSGLDFAPKYIEGMYEARDTLRRVCRDEEHAIKTIDTIRSERLHFPPPAAIEQAAGQFGPEVKPPSGDCEHCGGTGFEIVTRNGASGAKPCRCSPIPSVPDPKRERSRSMRQAGQIRIPGATA